MFYLLWTKYQAAKVSPGGSLGARARRCEGTRAWGRESVRVRGHYGEQLGGWESTRVRGCKGGSAQGWEVFLLPLYSPNLCPPAPLYPCVLSCLCTLSPLCPPALVPCHPHTLLPLALVPAHPYALPLLCPPTFVPSHPCASPALVPFHTPAFMPLYPLTLAPTLPLHPEAKTWKGHEGHECRVQRQEGRAGEMWGCKGKAWGDEGCLN